MRAGVRVLLVALLVWIAAPGTLAAENDHWAERLTFSTGRSVAYVASAPLRQAQPQVQIAILVVHGANRDDESNFARIMAAARASGKAPTTLVIAPRFKTADDQPAADEHVWTNDGWPSGDLSRDGKDAASRLGSFAVLDRLYAELSDTTRFPGLESVRGGGPVGRGRGRGTWAARVSVRDCQPLLVSVSR